MPPRMYRQELYGKPFYLLILILAEPCWRISAAGILPRSTPLCIVQKPAFGRSRSGLCLKLPTPALFIKVWCFQAVRPRGAPMYSVIYPTCADACRQVPPWWVSPTGRSFLAGFRAPLRTQAAHVVESPTFGFRRWW